MRPIHWCIISAAVLMQACSSHPDPAAPSQALSEETRDLGRHFEDVEAAFVVLDPQRRRIVRHNPERAGTRFIPASTFKIPNSLIALETGVAADVDFVLSWDSTKAARRPWWPDSYDDDQTLHSAFRGSVVWYYQELARRIGEERMRSYLERFEYGNDNLSAGIDRFWLEGGFAVSPDEQIEFLQRFYAGELGLSPRTTEIAKEIMVIDESDGVRLSGKTGTADLPGGRMVGWLVGYVELEEDVFFYALNFEGPEETVWEHWPAPRRIRVTRALLGDLEILPGSNASTSMP